MLSDTRARMIEATIQALRRRGVAGMSFTEILRDSGAARGAIYHHFPGGKSQLVAEAAAQHGAAVREQLAGLPSDSAAVVVAAFLAAVRPVVREAACGSGCAVASVTVHSGADTENAALRQVAATAFASWVDQLAERLVAAGLPLADAFDLAATLITLLEGAQVLCRATTTIEPFEQTVRAAMALVESRYPTS
ncbi:TetR/AcrR family transcriptional regulator [Kitasatospora sp. NBC_01287]|uniref:TetR/AcrR family transcriptional regulator n=1 Tax=Kitasatospora sp. NBC_01287 TaxID=2903573 RepID=UPI00225729F6|nr:TetR/AcrR family transcriptional regulator [Kitasatospora sp. NBC_01287]MCX4744188.1 TetR/AcrR family transcriptional regulator [Kitasatospora sp. NBC_01287]